jgi:hypothetical protein
MFMPRYQFTLNMPSRAGSLVHQVLGEHPAELNELLDEISNTDFLIVEEIYKDNDAGAKKIGGNYYSVGPLIIGTRWVGKVKIHQP